MSFPSPKHKPTPVQKIYRRRPRRPPFLRVLSVGMGVTSSVETQGETKGGGGGGTTMAGKGHGVSARAHTEHEATTTLACMHQHTETHTHTTTLPCAREEPGNGARGC